MEYISNEVGDWRGGEEGTDQQTDCRRWRPFAAWEKALKWSNCNRTLEARETEYDDCFEGQD